MALCSRANSVCSIDRPTHQLRMNPVSSTPLSATGRRPSVCSRRRPPACSRRRSCVAWSLPYSCEPSHQCVTSLMALQAAVSSPGVRVGSAWPRPMNILACQWRVRAGSSSGNGTSMVSR